MRRVAVLVLVIVVPTLLAAGTAHATTSPRQLYRALLKSVPASSLPPALEGSKTHSMPLSRGSRTHHAIGAVEVGNGQAIVGYLVFPSHALTLADLKAYPPNTGPNKIVTTHLAGFPKPVFVIHAVRNGYEAVYVIFVLDNVLVNSWTYGTTGMSSRLIATVEQDARWAKNHLQHVIRSG
jgi:hypothetical protein